MDTYHYVEQKLACVLIRVYKSSMIVFSCYDYLVARLAASPGSLLSFRQSTITLPHNAYECAIRHHKNARWLVEA